MKIKHIIGAILGLVFGILSAAFINWSFDFSALEEVDRMMILIWIVACLFYGVFFSEKTGGDL